MPGQPPLLPVSRNDPAAAFRFWVELDSIVEGVFTDCSGLNLERNVYEYREGGVNDHVHILPGRTKYPNLVLKRGFTLSHKLWEWYQVGLYDCVAKRVNFSILLYDCEQNDSRKIVKYWQVIDAFPVKWTGPDLKSDSNQIAIESIEIAHHGLVLDESKTS
jgi:phage tail-like protein